MEEGLEQKGWRENVKDLVSYVKGIETISQAADLQVEQ